MHMYVTKHSDITNIHEPITKNHRTRLPVIFNYVCALDHIPFSYFTLEVTTILKSELIIP